MTVDSFDSFEQELPEAAPEGFLFAAAKPGSGWQYHPGGGDINRAAQFSREMRPDEYGCEPKDQILSTN